ncbi:MAG TPA: hypothetical protein V6D17_01695 [Candidatus Obscuribacterales bacterium]
MLYYQLRLVGEQVRKGEIKLSDGLLVVFRYLRDHLPSERLMWLNRELLGYRRDDLEGFNESAPVRLFFRPQQKQCSLEFPQYRFLTGTWGRMDRSGRLMTIDDQRLAEKSIFCNIGIQQIETQIEEMDSPCDGMFSMSYDSATGAEYYIRSAELIRVYEAVRDKLCQFIELIIDELKLAPNEA